MKIRYKNQPDITGISSEFNTYGLGEVIVHFPDGSATSEEISELEVEIHDEWVDMRNAFRRRLLINDNYNIRFFEPQTADDRERGYTL